MACVVNSSCSRGACCHATSTFRVKLHIWVVVCWQRRARDCGMQVIFQASDTHQASDQASEEEQQNNKMSRLASSTVTAMPSQQSDDYAYLFKGKSMLNVVVYDLASDCILVPLLHPFISSLKPNRFPNSCIHSFYYCSDIDG